MFVKQGSIIPTMPVMNYTHEKPVYPLTFEIFPAQEGAQAAFTLYEDEGEDLGYQRDEFVKTPIILAVKVRREILLPARGQISKEIAFCSAKHGGLK